MGKYSEELLTKFGKAVSENSFKDQAIFFMNAMWTDMAKVEPEKSSELQAEKIYTYRLTMEEFNDEFNQGGRDLDDVQSGKFLEKHGRTMTALERRKQLREIDIDSNNRMGMLEFLVYEYKTDVKTLMSRPQGTNQALKDARKALNDVLDEIAKIENKKAEFQKVIDGGSGVKAIRAKAELAQLMNADPLPLNRAKISAEAKVRKAQKSKDLSAQGALWWIAKELEEAKRYKPKGGIDKSRFSVSK